MTLKYFSFACFLCELTIPFYKTLRHRAVYIQRYNDIGTARFAAICKYNNISLALSQSRAQSDIIKITFVIITLYNRQINLLTIATL